ncbi:MAG TPA: hypothetical protein VIY99_21035 [Terracidiphilus sp.]
MGQEAMCVCRWKEVAFEVKAFMEPPELILRGGLRRRIPFAAMQEVRADGDTLRFTVATESFALALGDSLAAKWAQAFLKPPPSLAKKLGITPETTVRVIGTVDDAALAKALSEAKAVSARDGDVIVARVNSPANLATALARATKGLERGAPIWLIHRKGPGHALNESIVRSTALAAGIVDTKVAAVSAALTGLRCVKRKS